MKNENKILKALFTSNALFILAESMLIPLYALFAEDIGASIVIISYLAATVFIVRVIGMLGIRHFGGHYFSPSSLLIVGFGLRAIAWFSLIFIFSIPFLFVTQAIIGLGQAVGSPGFLALFAKYVKDENGIRTSANWGIIEAVTAALGTVAGGYIVSRLGFDYLFGVMGVLAVISLLAYLFYVGDTITE